MISATHIPPEYRRTEYAPLTESDLQVLRNSMFVSEDGVMRALTDEEIREQVPGRITGVTDMRTGEYRPNQYFQS